MLDDNLGTDEPAGKVTAEGILTLVGKATEGKRLIPFEVAFETCSAARAPRLIEGTWAPAVAGTKTESRKAKVKRIYFFILIF